jgi:hypothetical protein
MSKFIEEHLFEFDKCFDEYSTNHDVESYLKINFLFDYFFGETKTPLNFT